jgi:putative ABC transport system permease protein
VKPIYLLFQKINSYLRRTPVAWLQLSYQKARLLVAILGVAFSIILIFTQLGLRAMLYDGVTLLPEHLNGDLYLLSSYAENIDRSSFPSIYLYQADAIEGVADARPLYVSEGRWVNPKLLNSTRDRDSEPPRYSPMQILAFNPAKPVFKIPEINRQLDILSVPGAILYDRLAKSELGNIAQLFQSQGYVSSILNNRRVTVMGLFSLSTTFEYKGIAVMSDWNFKDIGEKGNDSLSEVTLGVLSLDRGANKQAVIQEIKSNLSKDIKVLTPEELIQGERDFVATWPEGKILNFGAAIGFIIGVVIVYQVIYTDVSEHLPEYATLKAMGYKDRALALVVLQESSILAVMGFIPGYLASRGVYYLMEKFIEFPVSMNLGIALQVFLLNAIACTLAGAIAMKKLRTADPADIFY